MAVALPKPLAHSFTPAETPQTLDVVLPVLDRLEAMPVATRAELEAFLDAWNEVESWLHDYISKSNVATSCHTDDEEIQQRWADLISNVLPELSRRDDRLARKTLAAPNVGELEDTDYAPFLRATRTSVELFREENVALQQRIQQLTNEYQQISGSWSVEFQGEKRTMSAMFKFQSDPDREVRKAAWFAISEEVARTADQLETLFEEMFGIRHQIALNAGFENFRDYMFVAKLRDYDADACHNFADVVQREALPLVEELAALACERLGLDAYRPWDRHADPDGGAALNPFDDTETLKEGVERMMRRLDDELGEQFAQIRPNMDLDSRPGKAQGGFMAWYSWDRRPFIFANAAGNHSDIVTLLHEAGHAFHGLLSSNSDARSFAGVSPPMEFNEVASMSMELLHYKTLNEFYDQSDAERAIQQHLRRVVGMFPRTMLGDQFQHWMYTHPEHTRAERRAKWLELQRTFSPEIDVTGIDEETLANTYHQILHFFVVPFYFIEYAFAQFGSMQVAMRADEDNAAALSAYKEALKLGPQRDVRGLYEAAGAQFDPTPDTLRNAMDWVRAQLR